MNKLNVIQPPPINALPDLTDVDAPLQVEVLYSHDTRRIWLNINGKCVVRCQQIVDLSVRCVDAEYRVAKRAPTVKRLLDAAFGQLAHDCDPTDFGSIRQREELELKFSRILHR